MHFQKPCLVFLLSFLVSQCDCEAFIYKAEQQEKRRSTVQTHKGLFRTAAGNHADVLTRCCVPQGVRARCDACLNFSCAVTDRTAAGQQVQFSFQWRLCSFMGSPKHSAVYSFFFINNSELEIHTRKQKLCVNIIKNTFTANMVLKIQSPSSYK